MRPVRRAVPPVGRDFVKLHAGLGSRSACPQRRAHVRGVIATRPPARRALPPGPGIDPAIVPVKVVTEQVQSFEANNTLLGPVFTRISMFSRLGLLARLTWPYNRRRVSGQ
jgi:hypothetical protein